MPDIDRGDQLVENLSVRQREGEGFRRWFLNRYFELILWYREKGGELYGFQLCLSRNDRERAFTWTRDYSSSHLVSESYEERGFSNLSTGILKGEGRGVTERELEKFEAESAALDEELRSLVLARVRAFNERRSGARLPEAAP